MKMGCEEPDTQLNSVLKTIGVNECCSLIFTVSIIHCITMCMLDHTSYLVLSNIRKFGQ